MDVRIPEKDHLGSGMLKAAKAPMQNSVRKLCHEHLPKFAAMHLLKQAGANSTDLLLIHQKRSISCSTYSSTYSMHLTEIQMICETKNVGISFVELPWNSSAKVDTQQCKSIMRWQYFGKKFPNS